MAAGEQIVVIGASLGGLTAITEVLAGIPPDFPAPIAFVQHRSAAEPGLLVEILRRHTKLKVREPHDKDLIRPGHFYVAPPDYHLIVEGDEFALSTEKAVSYARPSIDVLFETAADAFGAGTIGVIMTGANHDGTAGCRHIKKCGGRVIAQDPSTAECAVMPRAAIEACGPDEVVPLRDIGPMLVKWCAP